MQYHKPALAPLQPETTVAGCCTGPFGIRNPKFIIAGKCIFNPFPPRGDQ